MNKIKSDTISQDKINSVLNHYDEGCGIGRGNRKSGGYGGGGCGSEGTGGDGTVLIRGKRYKL